MGKFAPSQEHPELHAGPPPVDGRLQARTPDRHRATSTRRPARPEGLQTAHLPRNGRGRPGAATAPAPERHRSHVRRIEIRTRARSLTHESSPWENKAELRAK